MLDVARAGLQIARRDRAGCLVVQQEELGDVVAEAVGQRDGERDAGLEQIGQPVTRTTTSAALGHSAPDQDVQPEVRCSPPLLASGDCGDDGGGEEPAGEDGYPYDDASDTNSYVGLLLPEIEDGQHDVERVGDRVERGGRCSDGTRMF
jgi:hypothetical protein